MLLKVIHRHQTKQLNPRGECCLDVKDVSIDFTGRNIFGNLHFMKKYSREGDEKNEIVRFFKRKVTKDEYETAYYAISEDVIENKDVYTIIEPVWWCINIYDGEEAYKKDLEQFNTEQKHIFAIEWYIAEVNNGGHDQFYFNSTGIVWEDAMQGFEAVGLQNNYKILKASAERLGGYPSKDRNKRQEQLDQYSPDFSDLDDRFYESEKDIETALLRYIRANKEKFVFKGILRRPKF